ncbi:MAG: N-acetyl-gamma-glutamyl-phosphate reductase [Verrucomicrobia bacterium]|nr:MAG: N-acetyl-gamma-glutamyl-phosphate reductase [Verrucomicrobiota bacterium]PYJ43188.1 MAG: N-acetyl-gamma-glutamyl-phosphate reductase [Verrucomicrobiota bacterium]
MAVAGGNKTKVAVIGASGYVGEELARLLLRHPRVELVAVTSRQFAGKTVAEVFPRFSHLEKTSELRFSEPDPEQLGQRAEIIFLALPHGRAAEFAKPLLQGGARAIDLSADFRIKSAKTYREFYGHDHPAPELLGKAVYGLPEIYRKKIADARLVACPGCYPTSILLPLLPLVREKVANLARILVTSLSGVSGAGRKIEADYLFAECNESMRPYGVPKHRHLSEIEEQLSVFAREKITIQFTPHLVPLNRGIITTIYVDLNEMSDAPSADERPRRTGDRRSLIDADSIHSIYEKAYRDEPFVRLLGDKLFPDTKNVTGTNFIDIAWRFDPRTRRLILMSAIDNLMKGASGQAVQCFNVMRGYRETEGLL